ncbi:MAG TPA: radical SAM family heme chaperone HemW [candidate division Zixibacteria bacterium]|nr:radical SAM family heme chaperone HemW [candidate division Zixibacteria bacterium]
MNQQRSAAPTPQSSIYLHFPFCSKLCGYCDFHKELFDRRRERLFFDALLRETELAAPEAQGSEIATVYVGGGTPSLMSLERFAEWIAALQRLYRFAERVEFTVELNPESAQRENLAAFRELGVNRLSIGVQSFDADALKLLDRRHNITDTLRVFYLARALGYEDFSADLIFGLPNQTLAGLQSDLEQLVEIEPTHISYYQLTVKENTPLERLVADGEIRLPDDDTLSVFYRAGVDFLADHGYERYEVSSFTKPGFQSQHNLRYWRGEPYLGLGPGAHGFTGSERYANVSDTTAYVESLMTDRKRPLIVDPRSERDQMVEEIMLGLRLSAGIERQRFFARHGKHVIDLVNKSEYKHLVESGLLIPGARSLRLSDDALALADEITARLLS